MKAIHGGIMKKISVVLMASLLIFLGACGGKEAAKEEVKKAEIKINENKVYSVPVNPTEYQAKTYNALSKALNDVDEEKIVTLVAQNFVIDFFTLNNKESAEAVGGLTYLPTARQEEFKTFATSYVYANYQLMEDEYGKDALPQVKEVKVESVTPQVIQYTAITPADPNLGTVESEETLDYDGYVVSVSITYEKSDVDSNELKKATTLSIIKVDDRFVVVAME